MRAPPRPTGWSARRRQPLDWRLWALALGLMVPPSLGSAACGAQGSPDSGPVTPGPTGGAPTMPALTLQFEGAPIAPLPPQTDAQITVRIQPPGAHVVRFSLLDATVGAALSRNEVVSGPDGRAKVILTTPKSPTRFALRAQVDSVAATTTILVDAGALTTLNVVPAYSGRRTVSTWTASVFPLASCSDFHGALGDGPFLVRSSNGSALELADVPAAGPLAVVVRADDGLAEGCTTLETPTPNGETSVSVAASDVPIALGSTVLDLVFGARADDAGLKSELQAGAALVQAGMRGPSDSEAAALLNGMASLLSDSERDEFERARLAAAWDETLPAALGRNGSTRIADAIARWLRDGQGALLSNQAIQARISASATAPEIPSLTVLRIAGALPSETGVTASGTNWSVDPKDTLAFSASISWPAASLVCAVLTAPATAETGSKDLGSSLARALSCEAVGSHLATSNGGEAALAWSTACDATCNADLCERALASQIQAACAASKKDLSTLSVLATGSAEVGAAARAVRFTGSWVGRLSRGTQKASSAGWLLGTAPHRL